MQKQQKLDIRLPPDVYVKTHNYSLAGSNPAYLYTVLYTGLRPFRFSSLLCLNQRPALALSLELYHVGKNAALMQQLCRRSLFCYCSIFEHHNLGLGGSGAFVDDLAQLAAAKSFGKAQRQHRQMLRHRQPQIGRHPER